MHNADVRKPQAVRLGNWLVGQDGLSTPQTSASGGTRRRRSVLLRVARQFAAQSDPERVMRGLLMEAQRSHGASGGLVSQWDTKRQQLVALVSTLPGAPATVGLGEGITGRAAELRSPLIDNDYPHFEARLAEFSQAGIQAVIAAPLLHEGHLLGVIVIVSDQPGKQFTSSRRAPPPRQAFSPAISSSRSGDSMRTIRPGPRSFARVTRACRKALTCRWS